MVQVRNVPVLRLQVAPVFDPLLQVPALADLQRGQSLPGAGHPITELFVGVQDLAGCDAGPEQIAKHAHIDRRAGADGRARQVEVDHLVVERFVAGAGGKVLRGSRRAGHQPIVVRILDQRVEEELGRAFEQGIDLAQVFLVAAEAVMFPQVRAEPGAADREGAQVEPSMGAA